MESKGAAGMAAGSSGGLPAAPMQLGLGMSIPTKSSMTEQPRSGAMIANLERDLNQLKMKLQMNEDTLDKTRTQLRRTEEEAQAARRKFFEKEIENENLKSQLQIKLLNTSDKSNRIIELTQMVERIRSEKAAVEGELTELKNTIQSNRKVEFESTMKVDELQLSLTQSNMRENSLKVENEYQQKRIASLIDQVEKLTAEVTSVRNDRAAKLCEFQFTLEQRLDDLLKANEHAEHIRRNVTKKDEQIARISDALQEQRDKQIEIEDVYQSRAAQLERTIQSLRDIIENDRRIRDLAIKRTEEIQSALQAATRQLEDVKLKRAQEKRYYEEKFSNKDTKIMQLEERIKELDDQVQKRSRSHIEQEMEMFYPRAASSYRAIRSDASFSQITEEHPILRERVAELERENEELRVRLSQTISEAEENAPLFASKVLEHKRAFELVQEMQLKLSQVINENQQLQEDRDTAIQEHNRVQRDILRYEQQCTDLGRQICRLMYRMNQIEGRSIYQENFDEAEDVMESSANKIISAHLVTFQNIEELQQQNRKLLSAIRDLAQERDEFEKEMSSSAEVDGYKTRLQEALREVEQLKHEQKQQKADMVRLVKERDALETFLQEFGRLPTGSNSGNVNNARIAELEDNLAKARSEIEQQRSLVAKRDGELAKLQTEIQQLNAQLAQKDVERLVHEQKHLLMVKEKEIEYLKAKEAAAPAVDTNDARITELQTELLKTRLEDEKKKTEISRLAGKITQLEAQIEALKEEATKLDADFKDKERRLITIAQQGKKRVSDLQAELIESNKQKEDFKTKLEALETRREAEQLKEQKQQRIEMARLAKERDALETALQEFRRQPASSNSATAGRIVELEDELTKVRSEIEQQKVLLTKRDSELAKLQAEFQQSNAQKDAEINKFKGNQLKLTKMLKERQELASKLTEDHTKQLAKYSELMRRNNEQTQLLKAKEKEIGELKAKEVAAPIAVAANTTRITELQTELLRTRSENEKQKAEISQHLAKIAQLEPQITALKDEAAKLDAALKEKEKRLVTVAQQAKKRIGDLQSDLTESIKQNEELKSKLQTISVASEQASQDLTDNPSPAPMVTASVGTLKRPPTSPEDQSDPAKKSKIESQPEPDEQMSQEQEPEPEPIVPQQLPSLTPLAPMVPVSAPSPKPEPQLQEEPKVEHKPEQIDIIDIPSGEEDDEESEEQIEDEQEENEDQENDDDDADDEEGSESEPGSEEGSEAESQENEEDVHSVESDGDRESAAEDQEESSQQEIGGDIDNRSSHKSSDGEVEVIGSGEEDEDQQESHPSADNHSDQEELDDPPLEVAQESNSQSEQEPPVAIEPEPSQPLQQISFARPVLNTALARQTMLNQQQYADETGDSIVPSTPTLYVPPRTDGFSEVVNSPRVPQDSRFTFGGSSSDAALGLAHMPAQGSIGVDDTRMDLSQFNENSAGRLQEVPEDQPETLQPADNQIDQDEVEEAAVEVSQESNFQADQEAPMAAEPGQSSQASRARRRLRIRGAGGMQTARRGSGWRGGRGRGRGANQ